jgi:hypothetical protein
MTDEALLCGFALEGFVIQAAAFFDFYLLHIACLLQIPPRRRLPEHDLVQILESSEDNSSSQKFHDVLKHYRLAAPKQRRGLIKSLRHSLVHRDELIPSFENNISLMEQLLAEAPPRILDFSCAEFCQDVQNDMFALVTDLSERLFGLEWKAGPYRPNLW